MAQEDKAEIVFDKKMAEAWMAAWQAGVMRTHFVCSDEAHLNRLLAAGQAHIISGVPFKKSTMLPIWVASRHSSK